MPGWSESGVGFRPLAVGDLPLVHDWLGREHVRRWWGVRADYEEVVEEYLAAIEGREPTDLFVIVVAGEDAGLIQTYLLADYPDYAALVDAGDEAAGLDIFLGDARLTGSRARHVRDPHIRFGRSSSPAPKREPVSPTPTSATSPRSARSRRPASRRCATFVDPEDDEVHAVMRLDRPARGSSRSAPWARASALETSLDGGQQHASRRTRSRPGSPRCQRQRLGGTGEPTGRRVQARRQRRRPCR